MALLVAPDKISFTLPLTKNLSLREGDLVTGTVTAAVSPGNVTINIGGISINAETRVPVEVGRPLLFRVSHTPLPGKIALQVVDSPADKMEKTVVNPRQDVAGVAKNDSQAVQQLVKTLVQSGSLPAPARRDLFDAVRAELKKMDMPINQLKELASLVPEQLKDQTLLQEAQIALPIESIADSDLLAALEATGIAMEAKLARPLRTNRLGNPSTRNSHAAASNPLVGGDLKAGLYLLQRKLREEEGVISIADKESALAGMKKILDQIALFQSLSIGTGTFSTFLPVDWEGLRRGMISIKQDRQKGEEIVSLRVDLDLVEHGELNLLLLMRRGAIYLSLKPEQEELRKILAGTIDDLVASCRKSGINIAAANVLELHQQLPEPLAYLEDVDAIVSVKV